MDEQSKAIVAAIIDDLNDRSGLGIDGLDEETQDEIRWSWEAIVWHRLHGEAPGERVCGECVDHDGEPGWWCRRWLDKHDATTCPGFTLRPEAPPAAEPTAPCQNIDDSLAVCGCPAVPGADHCEAHYGSAGAGEQPGTRERGDPPSAAPTPTQQAIANTLAAAIEWYDSNEYGPTAQSEALVAAVGKLRAMVYEG